MRHILKVRYFLWSFGGKKPTKTVRTPAAACYFSSSDKKKWPASNSTTYSFIIKACKPIWKLVLKSTGFLDWGRDAPVLASDTWDYSSALENIIAHKYKTWKYWTYLWANFIFPSSRSGWNWRSFLSLQRTPVSLSFRLHLFGASTQGPDAEWRRKCQFSPQLVGVGLLLLREPWLGLYQTSGTI